MNRNGVVQADLAALRRAVYARDAPPGAADAYAAALAAARMRAPGPAEAAAPSAVPASGRPVDAPRRHHRWAAIGAATGVAATLVLGAVLAARTAVAPVQAEPHAASAASPAAPGPTSTPLPNIVPPPVPGPVLASFTSTSGAVDARLDAGGRQVLLTGECGGDGTVTIRLSDGSNTILTCTTGLDGLSMAQSERPLGRFTLSTSTTGHPLWALTVGIVLNGSD